MAVLEIRTVQLRRHALRATYQLLIRVWRHRYRDLSFESMYETAEAFDKKLG